MEIDRIIFDGGRMKLIRNDEIHAEFPIGAVKDIELIRKANPRIEQVRAKHPRAYELWSSEEE